MSWTRTLLPLLLCACSGPADLPDPARAIARVLDEDDRLGGLRNHACETAPLATAVRDYVYGLEALDYQGCPEAFTTAFHRHIDAWRDSVPFLEQHADLRGEMHDLFDRIRARGGEDRARLEMHEAAIWGTWAEVEAARDGR